MPPGCKLPKNLADPKTFQAESSCLEPGVRCRSKPNLYNAYYELSSPFGCAVLRTSQHRRIDCAQCVYHRNLFTGVQNLETGFYGEFFETGFRHFLGGAGWMVAQ